MKKTVFIFFIFLLSVQAFNQNSFFRAVKLYYRVNPFDRKFSALLKDILSDTSFIKTEMKKRTDSTFFFLSGYYKRFNPFDFTAEQTQVRMAETEIIYDDSLNIADTIIIYQVLGIAGSGEDGKAKAQKELSRFHKRFSYDFERSDYKEALNDNMVTAGVYNYFVPGRSIAAMSAAWGKMPGETIYTFTVTIKLKIRENFAELPKTPYEL